MSELQGKAAIITGAGKGIGLALGADEVAETEVALR